MSTSEYRSKRDFRRTSEPQGSLERDASQQPLFVIQRHDASRTHYDFRIKAGGVLKSWAVPKGPSMDPREKRLAIPTEDHPVEYADFEGVIPKGEYGAGTVLIWDRGSYRNITENSGEIEPTVAALEAGHLLIELDGHKISGGYVLHRTGSGDSARWLLIKLDDAHADARRNPVSTEPESVQSGRTIEQIAAEEGREQ